MSLQAISGDYISSNWFRILGAIVETRETNGEEYKPLGTFTQGTNWEKVFAIGNKINNDLQITEQEIVDEVTNLRKRKIK